MKKTYDPDRITRRMRIALDKALDGIFLPTEYHRSAVTRLVYEPVEGPKLSGVGLCRAALRDRILATIEPAIRDELKNDNPRSTRSAEQPR
jgi:hypothetical protein